MAVCGFSARFLIFRLNFEVSSPFQGPRQPFCKRQYYKTSKRGLNIEGEGLFISHVLLIHRDHIPLSPKIYSGEFYIIPSSSCFIPSNLPLMYLFPVCYGKILVRSRLLCILSFSIVWVVPDGNKLNDI